MMQLQTKRLILRTWHESDAEALYKYAKNPNIGPVAGWQPHTGVENSREIIKNVLSADETYAVVLKTTGEAVGSIGLMMASGMHSAEMKNGECEIGYWIGEPLWGQGLIPEAVNELLRHAFEDLHFAAAWCGYYDGNEKSRRVQEKCGFTFHHTEHNKPVPLMNDCRTEHFTKLLREDWEKLKMTKTKKEKKSKNIDFSTITKYLRELSVVIIGVAVTFIGSNIINSQKAKNDLKSYLDAVKIELEDNLEIARENTEYYRHTRDFARYLTSDYPEELSPDSVNILGYQRRVVPRIFTVTYKSSAFEMLKSSGTMHLVADKKLFQYIVECYMQLEHAKHNSDLYMSRKLDMMYRVHTEKHQFHLNLLAPECREVYFFFAIDINLDVRFEECAAQIEKTVDML